MTQSNKVLATQAQHLSVFISTRIIKQALQHVPVISVLGEVET